MKFSRSLFPLLPCAFLAANPPTTLKPNGPGQVPEENRYAISATAIGPIKLGMTLMDCQKKLPKATFKRGSDGDGAALINVQVGGSEIMTLSTGEDDPDKPLAWNRKVEWIETFSYQCQLPGGIHVGSLVSEAEKVYGNTISIEKSEIESREYIRFKHPPNGIIFRIDYSGLFKEGSKTTNRFAPNAKIFSIAIPSN